MNEILYADDLVLMAETMVGLEKSLKNGRLHLRARE